MAGGSGPDQAQWFAEFKKINKGAPTSPPKTETNGQGKSAERRAHSRFGVDECQATLYREGLLTVFGVSKQNRARAALDLSEGGVRFVTTERLPIGTRVRMIIQMEKYKDQIEASGEVRWCYQSLKKTGDFYVGVQFTNLDPVQKRKIAQMREWFTSPQYRAVKEKRKAKEEDEFTFPA
jgi:Tfp pilus assembly protein PilZ